MQAQIWVTGDIVFFPQFTNNENKNISLKTLMYYNIKNNISAHKNISNKSVCTKINCFHLGENLFNTLSLFIVLDIIFEWTIMANLLKIAFASLLIVVNFLTSYCRERFLKSSFEMLCVMVLYKLGKMKRSQSLKCHIQYYVYKFEKEILIFIIYVMFSEENWFTLQQLINLR